MSPMYSWRLRGLKSTAELSLSIVDSSLCFDYYNLVILAVNSKLESKGVCAQRCVAVFFFSGEDEVGKGFG